MSLETDVDRLRTEVRQISTKALRAQVNNLDHGADLAGLLDNDHTQYPLKSIATTKGDLWVATGAGTLVRLAVGSDGDGLTADSGEASGVKWAAGGTWGTWSPSYSAGLTIGNGTVVARYVQVGKTVYAYWELTWGSTTGITGDVTVSTPVTVSSQYTTGASEVGIVMFVDISTRTNDTTGHILLASTTTFELFAMVIAGARLVLRPMVNDINPHTWATGDIMSFRAIYEAA